MTSRKSRIRGCLFGGAIGDAMGACFEGVTNINSFEIPNDLFVTDDTQLTLATAESIIESNSVNPESVAASFVRWFRERRITGIGSSTLKALTELDLGGHWAFVGASGERAAGNGAAMRIAPVAFFLNPEVESQRQTIRDVCRITHRNDEAYIGALAIVRTIRFLIADGKLDRELLPLLVHSLPDSNVRDRLNSIQESSLTIAEYENNYSSSGYVVDSVPLAILAAIEATDFLETVEQLIRFGGDTDTIASMFGQIFGAAHGLESLPRRLAAKVNLSQLIQDTANNLFPVLPSQ